MADVKMHSKMDNGHISTSGREYYGYWASSSGLNGS